MTRSPQSSREGNTLVITMDDGRANVIDDAWVTAMDAALDDSEASDVRAVVIKGRHKFFSAGLDIRSLPSLAPLDRQAVIERYATLMVRLARFPKPVVAAVDGHAMAGGAIVLLACDRRISSAGGWRIGLTEMSIGVPLPDLALSLARLHLRPQCLQEALLEGRAYSPEEACLAGFVQEVVSSSEVSARALALADQLGSLDNTAYGLTKRRIRDQVLRFNVEAFGREISSYLGSMSAH
jgi:enoyl-CoA hydratase